MVEIEEPPPEEPVQLQFTWDYLTFDKVCQVNTIMQSVPTCPTITEVLTSDITMSACASLVSMEKFNALCQAVEHVTIKSDV